MKVKVISVVIGSLETVLKGLEKGLKELEIGGRIKTVKRSARIQSKFPESWSDLLSLKFQSKIVSKG